MKSLDAELTKLEVAGDKDAQAPIRTRLAELEREARAQGMADRKTVAKIDEELKSGNLKINHADLVSRRELHNNRLAEIDSLVTLPTDGNPLYRVFDDDHEDWWVNQFYMGGEFDSASGILNKGYARLGYSSWLHAGGEDIPESHPRNGWGNYGRTWIFNALLTSSGEQSVAKLLEPLPATDPCATNTTSTAKCSRRALETEQSLWLPLYRSRRHNRIRWYLGPVVSVGATFVDPSDDDETTLQAAYRYYAGMRVGFARDAFAEVLLGKSSTLNSRRLEIAGEIPIAKWGSKSRLLLGWNTNLRAGGDAVTHIRTRVDENTFLIKTIPERDIYRVYVVYELDFLTLTGLQPPK